MKNNRKLIWTGVLTAIGSSLCCITPLLALIAGGTGFASAFSWVEPLRPYLVGISFLVLGFAWYQKLKPQKEVTCQCDTKAKTPFLQTKTFLALVTVFSLSMLAFPYYSDLFYPKTGQKVIVVESANIQKVALHIDGMTCDACAKHVNHAVENLDGIVGIQTSYENGQTEIRFDQTKTNIQQIEKAINSTGYLVKNKN